MQLAYQQVHEFQEIVWHYYHQHRRAMPWRENHNPYFVLTSELMLQQTQVQRVVPKFEAFARAFPDVQTLAAASLSEVLKVWNGLGYNRRAKFLHETAQLLVKSYNAQLPQTVEELVKLPGIGKNTAGAIMVYAFNQPAIFIETNIRSVYFHHFFPGQEAVADQEVRLLLSQTLDYEHPREWYWALMDYGTYLKQTHGNNIAMSRHYVRQSAFVGSKRQVRGKVIKILLEGSISQAELYRQINDKRLGTVLEDLTRENFITKIGQKIQLVHNLAT